MWKTCSCIKNRHVSTDYIENCTVAKSYMTSMTVRKRRVKYVLLTNPVNVKKANYINSIALQSPVFCSHSRVRPSLQYVICQIKIPGNIQFIINISFSHTPQRLPCLYSQSVFWATSLLSQNKLLSIFS